MVSDSTLLMYSVEQLCVYSRRQCSIISAYIVRLKMLLDTLVSLKMT